MEQGRGNVRPFNSLRDWLEYLEGSGRVARARPGVPLAHTLAALAKRMDGVRATRFPGAGGHSIEVVSGLLSSRAWVAEAMAVPMEELSSAYGRAIENPIEWREVSHAEAPVKEVVVRAPDLTATLPIPLHNEHDSGAYITAGLLIARNPATGVQNVSINRLQVSGPDRLGILILPRDLHRFHDLAEGQNQALDVAIVIGADPLTMLASQAIVPIDTDELCIAGALHGEALRVVRCEGSELRVPANAEIVIEGRLLPGVREEEGPFGEFPQYYGPAGKRQVIEVDTLTHRQSPLYHTIVPAAGEHLQLGAIPREASLLALLKRSFPSVRDVYLTPGGVCRYHVVVKIAKRFEGEAKNIILAALSAHADNKQVVVVDEDVDIYSAQSVEWAIATRFQAGEDLVSVFGAQGSRLDPSSRGGIVDKLGFDATRPLSADPFRYTVVHVPGEDDPELDAWFDHA